MAVLTRWLPLTTLVLAQICYPLSSGDLHTALVAIIVTLGFSVSLGHALATRGARVAAALVAVTAGAGFGIEAIGVATGVPFGEYDYGTLPGPKPLGVPVLVPLAWTWMAWPAWLAAGQLVRRVPIRVAVAGFALAAWDLFLDPHMVAEGNWRWTDPRPTLPGVEAVPVGNHLAWLGVAIAMMALLWVTAGPAALPGHRSADAPMLLLYLWTYASSVFAHAFVLDLPGSAVWGGLGMGLIALPVAAQVMRAARPVRPRPDPIRPHEAIRRPIPDRLIRPHRLIGPHRPTRCRRLARR